MNNTTKTAEPVAVFNEEDLLFDFQQILSNEAPITLPPPRIQGVVIGHLVGQDPSGQPLVDFAGNLISKPIAAQAVATFVRQDFGRQVALLFENGDPCRPILMGLIHEPGLVTNRTPAQQSLPLSVHTDDERIELKADREIVLKCGKASITLTRAGKVLIRGAYLSSRSSGVNRIKGGSVQIN